MRMGQGVRTGLGHGGITCVLQKQFSSLYKNHLSMKIKIRQKIYLFSSFNLVKMYFFI